VYAFTLVGYAIFFIAQLLAYCILILAYVSQTRTLSTNALTVTPMVALFAFQTLQPPAIKLLGPLVEYHPVSEIVLLFLVSYITLQTSVNYSVTKDANALLVFLGFLLLTLSHLLFILVPLGALLFVLGHILQLLGFVALLVMLLRVTGTK
jgi:hypothetical protein